MKDGLGGSTGATLPASPDVRRSDYTPWTTPIPPLRHGEIRDAGYSEFIVSETFATELLDGGMTHINGQPVWLKVVDRLPGIGGVLIRWHPAPCTAEDLLAEPLEAAA
jgi:hypothetical protein